MVLALAWVLVACTTADERRQRTIELAEQLLTQGDRATAAATLESFLRYDPRDLVVTVRLSRLELDGGNVARALSRLEALPADAPRDAKYFEVLTRAQILAGRVEQALPLLLARPELADGDPTLVDTLVARTAQLPHLTLPELPAPWRTRRVKKLIRAGRLHVALAQWRLLPEDQGDKGELLEHLIQAALAKGETDLLRRAEEVHTEESVTPWKLLARHRLFLERGAEGEAAAVERLFLQRYSGHPERFDVLMSLLQRENRRGRADQALRLAEEAVSLRPSAVDAMVERALALRSLGRKDAARAQLELVLALDPDHRAARLLLRRDDEARRNGEPGTAIGKLELKLEASGP